ncbi:MAG: hypothetical protein WCC84_03100 [Candidatus Cybelea sp.]
MYIGPRGQLFSSGGERARTYHRSTAAVVEFAPGNRFLYAVIANCPGPPLTLNADPLRWRLRDYISALIAAAARQINSITESPVQLGHVLLELEAVQLSQTFQGTPIMVERCLTRNHSTPVYECGNGKCR